MTEQQQKRPWALPLLAHIALVCSLPFWFLILAFSPMVLTGHESTPPPMAYLMLGIFWLPPLISLALIGLLWLALYRKQAQRAVGYSVAFILIQVGAVLWLMQAH